MNYPINHPIRYQFSRFTPIGFELEKEDENWDIICSEYHEEMNKIISSHIIELNKWKDIKRLEALGLENLNKLSKLVSEAISNLEDKNDKRNNYRQY